MEETENEEIVPPEDGIQDEEVESSTTETQEEESPEKEVPFDEHPRWKEIQTAKHEAERSAAEAKAQAEYYRGLAEREKTPQQEERLYEANTPEEREFWNKIEKIAEKKAEAKTASLKERFEAEKTALLNQYGQLAAKDFLKDHPDVQKGSDELNEIVQVARDKNLDLDHAYRIVMFDRVQENVLKEQKVKKQKKTQEKVEANVETKSVPKQSPVSQREADFTAEFDRVSDELGVKIT